MRRPRHEGGASRTARGECSLTTVRASVAMAMRVALVEMEATAMRVKATAAAVMLMVAMMTLATRNSDSAAANDEGVDQDRGAGHRSRLTANARAVPSMSQRECSSHTRARDKQTVAAKYSLWMRPMRATNDRPPSASKWESKGDQRMSARQAQASRAQQVCAGQPANDFRQPSLKAHRE